MFRLKFNKFNFTGIASFIEAEKNSFTFMLNLAWRNQTVRLV